MCRCNNNNVLLLKVHTCNLAFKSHVICWPAAPACQPGAPVPRDVYTLILLIAQVQRRVPWPFSCPASLLLSAGMILVMKTSYSVAFWTEAHTNTPSLRRRLALNRKTGARRKTDIRWKLASCRAERFHPCKVYLSLRYSPGCNTHWAVMWGRKNQTDCWFDVQVFLPVS